MNFNKLSKKMATKRAPILVFEEKLAEYKKPVDELIAKNEELIEKLKGLYANKVLKMDMQEAIRKLRDESEFEARKAVIDHKRNQEEINNKYILQEIAILEK